MSHPEIIHSYSRSEALADGFLVDVSELAKQAGFKVPVAMTRAAWSQYVEWTDTDSMRQVHQSQTGRLWDVLVMCMHAARGNNASGLTFQLKCVPRDGVLSAVLVRLKATIDGGDDGQPVVTIMLPDED